MKRAILTVGLGFGDEGKGAAVDYLSRQYDADLVVRYCGGSQAGHNVQLPDGRRHTFSQFGAGTFADQRPRTFLGPNVIIDPPALRREAQHLVELGVAHPARLLTIHPDCLVTTPWLRLLNQLREHARGADRHGSCGQGIGEARCYWLKHGRDAVVAADLRDRHVLRAKLEIQRQRVLLESQELLPRITGDVLAEMELWRLNATAVTDELAEALPTAVTVADCPDFRTAVFEGAQGVLLDEYRGFHPHTTWNTVTLHHAWELVEATGVTEVAVLGITRTYLTRHGAGPLPTYNADLTERLRDPGNPANAWQGSLRCGWLDLPLLRYAAACVGPLDGLVVNHLDQVDGRFQMCERYDTEFLKNSPAPNLAWQARLTEQLQRAGPALQAAGRDEIIAALAEIAPVVIQGAGPDHRARRGEALHFRRRRGVKG